MSKRYKLLLLDLDGTTVASKGDALPSRRVVTAVQQAQKYLHVALATGRPIQGAQPVIDALSLHGPSVLNGGSQIIDLTTGKELHRQDMQIATLQELVKLALPFGYKIYTDDDQYGAEITSPNDITNKAAKLFIDTVDMKDTNHMLDELAAVKGAAAHLTSSWNDGDVMDIHITHEHATKRYGVERLIALLGYTKDQVMAIGDGYNDVPMLEAAGLKIVMGNAPAEIKAIADYVAPSLDDDGVAEAIEQFILI